MSFLRGLTFRWRYDRTPLSVYDYRRAAQRALPAAHWALLESGADDEMTLLRNRMDFQRWQLRQRVLTGNDGKDLAVEVGGVPLDLPVALSPAGLNGMFHSGGELAAARAAERCGTRHTASTASSYTLEEIADGTREAHWFQLYPWADRQLMAEFVARARKAGCGVLFVTVDVPVVGNRPREKRDGWSYRGPVLTPARIVDAAMHPRWVYGYTKHRRVTMVNFETERGASAAVRAALAHGNLMRPELLSWENLAWLRDEWQGPLFVKGVMDPEDARRVVEIGCTGVVVSNHGGRQLDCQSSSIAALPAVVDAIGDRGEVLLEGGVRRGTDVVKALCLGAKACMIGRPFLYGLAARGEDGVADVIGILRREIETTLALMGCASVSELKRSWLQPVDPLPGGSFENDDDFSAPAGETARIAAT